MIQSFWRHIQMISYFHKISNLFSKDKNIATSWKLNLYDFVVVLPVNELYMGEREVSHFSIELPLKDELECGWCLMDKEVVWSISQRFITSHCPFIDILVTLTISPTWDGQFEFHQNWIHRHPTFCIGFLWWCHLVATVSHHLDKNLIPRVWEQFCRRH